ncbi:hypothetical protein CON66_00105 [Bacillus cereus]|uniref:DUF4145 domain-containing protein n=1 Tax=Bacillus cereus TaxID=1396 RepID=UPI000BEC953D|nr:DUF4145 domain-containing protein [Bacillus cereus]PEA97929.1 hypothetical protein CON66_00105 [Bacillus cereus]
MSNYLFENQDKHPTFTCPHCYQISSQGWKYIYGPNYPRGKSKQINPESIISSTSTELAEDNNPFHHFNLRGVILSTCNKCDSSTYWLKSLNAEEIQVYPSNSSDYPQPHEDMPDHIRKTFKEAGSVMHLSLGSSAALSRLTLENLLKHLGYEKGSLNDKIGKVISEGKVSAHVGRMLDIIRTYGNSGAHSGIINLDENPEIPKFLLELINLVVEHMITLPKKVDTMFDAIPPGIRAGIEKRDTVK